MRKPDLTRITDHAGVSEKSIERYLVEKAKEHGLPCLKYSNPGMVGYPDRLLVLPSAKVIWVELKSRGRKPDKRQLIRHAELSRMGHVVRVIDNKADIDGLLDSIVK
ncbi:MAG: VRR-NUC domain-containing protein [Pseudoflavonifractor sp.]|nr:VRR-NUC domain-containing protein [Pseudoflavonifractor sp.]